MKLRFSNYMRYGWLCLLPVLALIFSGCAPLNQAETNDDNLNIDVAHLHVGDTVTVTLSGLPTEIPPHEEAIKEDGTITLQDIGSVKAAGKTPGQLQSDIYHAYVPRFYNHLTVTVTASSQRVYYVHGEVKEPGQELYRDGMTVTRAIASAGDFTDFADHKNVWLIRSNGQRIKVNCTAVLNGDATDPVVHPGDQIQVSRSVW